ncbi:MAG: transcriptional regulator [Candidatus Aminicenantaceae bacterium]
MTPETFSQLDPVIHSRVRLGVLTILASVKNASFIYLKEKIGATDGNLSANLTRLENEGFIQVKKTFAGKKPLTTCSITGKGRSAFAEYLKTLESLLPLKTG